MRRDLAMAATAALMGAAAAAAAAPPAATPPPVVSPDRRLEVRLAVAPAEYSALTPELKHAVNASYEARWKRMAPSRERDEELRKGVKRVDFLCGRTRFRGLSCTQRGPAVWMLNVS